MFIKIMALRSEWGHNKRSCFYIFLYREIFSKASSQEPKDQKSSILNESFLTLYK
jgi:hypothetical protein